MILELSDQDNVALEEISKILERHPDLKLIEMVVEPTLIFNHLIIDTGKRKVAAIHSAIHLLPECAKRA